MTMTDKERPVVPPTEVRPKAKRRTFSASYKARILAEADKCTEPGKVGALLRRVGAPNAIRPGNHPVEPAEPPRQGRQAT
jgi:hypothetical protein